MHNFRKYIERYKETRRNWTTLTLEDEIEKNLATSRAESTIKGHILSWGSIFQLMFIY